MAANQRNISFATFNLYNLQLPGRPMYARSKPYTEAAYRTKIDWTAAMLRRLDADVIAFQELWSREALEGAFDAAGLRAEYDLAFIKDGAWDGIAVAAAVRRPWTIAGTRRHKAFPAGFRLKKRKRSMAEIRADQPDADAGIDPTADPEFLPSHEDDEIEVTVPEFSRSPLQVTVRHERARNPTPPAIDIFCTHLKSKLATPLDDAEYRDPTFRPHRNALGGALSAIRRTAEAAALRIILNDTMAASGLPTVVLGDLNDGQFSDVLGILTGQPTFRVAEGSRAGERSAAGLYTGVQLQQLRSLGDVYYTHEFKNVRQVIDHALVSQHFYDHSAARLWAFEEMLFLNDHVADHRSPASDHGVVRAAFRWLPRSER